jgi:hypothetical protein
MRNKIISLLLVLHLSVIFMGTCLIDFGKIPVVLQAPIVWYLAVTGGHPYNFFSPDVPSQIVVRCYITDSAGKIEMETFDRNTNTFELRSNYLFQLLDNNGDQEAAANIAAHYCFAHHHNAKSVRVSINKFMVPSIHEYKTGKHCYYSELYTQDFTHE